MRDGHYTLQSDFMCSKGYLILLFTLAPEFATAVAREVCGRYITILRLHLVRAFGPHDVAINQLPASNRRMEIRSAHGVFQMRRLQKRWLSKISSSYCLDEVDVARFIGTQAPQTPCLIQYIWAYSKFRFRIVDQVYGNIRSPPMVFVGFY